MDERRTLRVSEALREELTEIIGFETEDPRLLAVDVTEVHVSQDGRHANVRVGLRGNEKEQDASLAALDHAGRFPPPRTGQPADPAPRSRTAFYA